MKLEGKVVAVTGAFGQLGQAVVAEMVRQGAKVALLDIAEGKAPEGSAAWKVNLTSLADVKAALDGVAQRFGGIDALVNVAGGFRWQTLEGSADLGEWSALFEINVLTCVTASKSVLPHLQKRGGGRIVNIGAMGAAKGSTGMGAYAASKAAVARFTEALADELKLKNITVNAVLPSIIDTPQNRQDMPDADVDRWVKPTEIARVIGFLLSDSASAVTGALLPVSGKT
ncbi:MAG TPA: SDR family NAD(P)-dependent oxidoreductase [Vineibacter sp.]|nr:SDR family NAD(P)-dependent oxidoreductase [Vineibacter sp.]